MAPTRPATANPSTHSPTPVPGHPPPLQRAIHVALMPAVHKHQALAKLLARKKDQEGEEDDEAPLEEQA